MDLGLSFARKGSIKHGTLPNRKAVQKQTRQESSGSFSQKSLARNERRPKSDRSAPMNQSLSFWRPLGCTILLHRPRNLSKRREIFLDNSKRMEAGGFCERRAAA